VTLVKPNPAADEELKGLRFMGGDEEKSRMESNTEFLFYTAASLGE